MTEDNNPTTPEKKRGGFGRTLMINIGCMIVAGIVLAWLALLWLDVWTDHGEETPTPTVLGMSYPAASRILEQAGFTVEILDSVYDTTRPPGSVTDQTPKEGSMVKHGREIYLTVTASSPKMVTLPRVTDVSERLARASLNSIGITKISTVVVPGEYKDLVVGVSVDGRRVNPGSRVPVTSRVTLEVSSGPVNEIVDSMALESDGQEDDAIEIFDPHQF